VGGLEIIKAELITLYVLEGEPSLTGAGEREPKRTNVFPHFDRGLRELRRAKEEKRKGLLRTVPEGRKREGAENGLQKNGNRRTSQKRNANGRAKSPRLGDLDQISKGRGQTIKGSLIYALIKGP